MDETTFSKKYQFLVGFILVLILCVIATSYYSHRSEKNSTPVVSAEPVQNTTPEVIKSEMDGVSSHFPSSISIDTTAKEIHSTDYGYGPRQQTDVTFISAKNIKTNTTYYQEFLKNDNWTVTDQKTKNNTTIIVGQKDETQLVVMLSARGLLETSTSTRVTLSYIKK